MIDDNGGRRRYPVSTITGVPITSRNDDDLDGGPLREPFTFVRGHKVYRKEACTYDHRPTPGRTYFGLTQCACCFGIISPGLKRIRRGRYATVEVRGAA